jgi:hypothetical protein
VNRIIYILLAIVLGIAAPARDASADEPTKEQLEQAKKAFAEGNALYEEGKVPEAIEKFKESYRLSKKPVLLYNIGHALDGAGDKQKALFYYRKFLADAPKDAKQRKEVSKRVEEIEKENFEAELNGTAPSSTGGGTGGSAGTGTKQPEEARPPVKVKPAGTYAATDFQHQMVESAPPGKPLDVTAFVPEDSGWTVTLYYRGSGDAKFIAKVMKWRYKELVGRIPGDKIAGSSIQYYVDAKDSTGTVIARSGKSTSPNLVNVDAATPPRFYPDFTDDATEASTETKGPVKQERDEDPLSGKKEEVVETPLPTGPTQQGTGFADVGSSKFNKAKWISTGLAGALIAGAVVTFVLGKQQASNIEADRDARMGTICESPPCFEFDTYDIDVQNAGERYNTWHTVTAVTGVIAAGVAGYFWYKELTAKKRGDTRTVGRKRPQSPAAPDLVVAPALGDGFAGAAAAVKF